jgi:hypothetical protein
MVVGRLVIGVVIGSNSVLAVVEPSKIDKLPSNLDRSQVEEVTDTLELNARQGSVQPDEGVLKNIIGLHPPTEIRPTMEHFSRESEKPVAGMVEELILGRRIPIQGHPQKALEVSVRTGDGRRG